MRQNIVSLASNRSEVFTERRYFSNNEKTQKYLTMLMNSEEYRALVM